MNFTKKSIYLITGEPCNEEEKFLERLRISLSGGIRLVQIRAKSLNSNQYKKLALKAVQICREYGATVLLSTHIDLIEQTEADGIHLPSAEFMQLNTRPIAGHYLFSVACHNEEQLIHAANIGADFAVICPVFATPSSPMGNPLGWKKFSSLTRLSKIPAYALGGMTLQDIESAKSYGAVGIAAIRSVWGVINKIK